MFVESVREVDFEGAVTVDIFFVWYIYMAFLSLFPPTHPLFCDMYSYSLLLFILWFWGMTMPLWDMVLWGITLPPFQTCSMNVMYIFNCISNCQSSCHGNYLRDAFVFQSLCSHIIHIILWPRTPSPRPLLAGVVVGHDIKRGGVFLGSFVSQQQAKSISQTDLLKLLHYQDEIQIVNQTHHSPVAAGWH